MLKYLGIRIPSDLTQLYVENYSPLMQRTLQDLKKYDCIQYLWFGRINILKINIFPCFLFLFQTIPIVVPRAYFVTLQTDFARFIWGGNRPRLHRTILSLP